MLLHVELPELRIKIWTSEALKTLPPLAVIADGFSERGVAYDAVRAVQAGAPWVHLRDHSLSAKEFWEVGRIVVGRLRRANEDVLISINGHPQYAAEWHCAVHCGSSGPSVAEVRRFDGINGPVGYSAHDPDDARRAFEDGADYIFYSPVFPTPSKPGDVGVGIEGLRDVATSLAPRRVFALGGIGPSRVGACLDAGAAGVAVVSAVIGSDDAQAATRALLQQLQKS